MADNNTPSATPNAAPAPPEKAAPILAEPLIPPPMLPEPKAAPAPDKLIELTAGALPPADDALRVAYALLVIAPSGQRILSLPGCWDLNAVLLDPELPMAEVQFGRAVDTTMTGPFKTAFNFLVKGIREGKISIESLQRPKPTTTTTTTPTTSTTSTTTSTTTTTTSTTTPAPPTSTTKLPDQGPAQATATATNVMPATKAAPTATPAQPAKPAAPAVAPAQAPKPPPPAKG